MITKFLNNYCRKLNISPTDLTGQSQKQPIPLYRAVFAYLMYPNFSQSEVARVLKSKPSTVNSAIRRLRGSLLVGDKSLRHTFKKLNVNIYLSKMKRPDFNTLSKQIYEANKEKGFHDEVLSDKHYLTLVISELMEAIEADRKGKRADIIKYYYYMDNEPEPQKEISFPTIFNTYIKDTVEDELADAVIRLLDFAGTKNFDLSDMAHTVSTFNNTLFTENIWDVIYELVACEDEEAVFCAIKKIEDLSKRMFIDLWGHVDLKLKYNRTRPYRHNKLY